MLEMFDYCIAGNGLLGASAAEYLARKGYSVCVIGAEYGASGRYFSSHEDDTRIHRTWHADKYWEELSIANHQAMLDLEARSGVEIVTPVPLYYDFHDPAFVPRKPHTAYLRNNGFAYQDSQAGLINPKRYIAALNAMALSQGAIVHRGVVSAIEPCGSGYKVSGAGNDILCKKVIDTRGIHMPPDQAVRVQAKIVLFATHEKGQDMHCFVKTKTDSDLFKDMYACVAIGAEGGRDRSKFGFSERQPVFLDSPEALSDWFKTGYPHYPYLDQARELIRQAGYDNIQDLTARPCAFTTTADARPQIRLDDGYLGVSGCNGMAAKCCQALMSTTLEQYRF